MPRAPVVKSSERLILGQLGIDHAFAKHQNLKRLGVDLSADNGFFAHNTLLRFGEATHDDRPEPGKNYLAGFHNRRSWRSKCRSIETWEFLAHARVPIVGAPVIWSSAENVTASSMPPPDSYDVTSALPLNFWAPLAEPWG